MSEAQVRFGAMMDAPAIQNAKNLPGSPLSRNYIIPRTVAKTDILTPELVKFLGDQVGISGAVAGEEITHSLETGDDVSLERNIGEIAPLLEGFTQPSPVMTSKGRARSAVVDRSGVQARIVDPMERKAIRDDIYKDDTMTVMDKMKKTLKLNKTEKIDLDPAKAPEVPMAAPVAPQSAPPKDVFNALNEGGGKGPIEAQPMIDVFGDFNR